MLKLIDAHDKEIFVNPDHIRYVTSPGKQVSPVVKAVVHLGGDDRLTVQNSPQSIADMMARN